MVFVMLFQIIAGIVYGVVFGPQWDLEIPWYLGWVVLAVGLPFFFSPLLYFQKRGKPQEGKNFMSTTVVVDSGTYGIVRHPQILGCILLMFASILISQHWAAVIIGIPLSIWFYVELPEEEKGLAVKFGEDYQSYMQRVPRINFLAGVIRWLRRGLSGVGP